LIRFLLTTSSSANWISYAFLLLSSSFAELANASPSVPADAAVRARYREKNNMVS
jgi:hypothetical protein